MTYVLMVDIVLPAVTYDALKLIDKLQENISGYSQNDLPNSGTIISKML